MLLYKYKLLFIIILLNLIFIFSCSLQNEYKYYSKHNTLESKWEKHKLDLMNINSYKINGSFIYRSSQNKLYIPFYLQKINKNNYRLLLLNIFGTTEYEIYLNSNNIIHIIGNKDQYYNINLEKIIGKMIGIEISLNNLYSWIVGLPGDKTQYLLNQDDKLYKIDNDKYQVYIKDYNNRLKPNLPKTIELKFGNKYIKLFINTWIL